MKKIIIAIVVVSGMLLMISLLIRMNDSQTSTLMQSNIEALADGEDHNINCIPDNNSICVDGAYVELHSYYSPH